MSVSPLRGQLRINRFAQIFVFSIVSLSSFAWTSATPILRKVSFYPRQDGKGYVIWFDLTERSFRYDLKRQGLTLNLTLFDTSIAYDFREAAPTGPVLAYEITPQADRLTIQIELDPNQPVDSKAYPDQGTAILVGLTYTGVSNFPSMAGGATTTPAGGSFTAPTSQTWTSQRRESAAPGYQAKTISPAVTNEAPQTTAPVTTQTNKPQPTTDASQYAHSGARVVSDYNNPNVAVTNAVRFVDQTTPTNAARTNVKRGQESDYFTPTATTTNKPVLQAQPVVLTKPEIIVTQTVNTAKQTVANVANPASVTAGNLLDSDNPLRSTEVEVLEVEADNLAQQLVLATTTNQRRTLETQLESKLGQIFDAEQLSWKKRIQGLRATATEEEKQMLARARTKTVLISERKQQIMSRAQSAITPVVTEVPKSVRSNWDF